MDKAKPKPRYLFCDPNPEGAVERALRRILLEKLRREGAKGEDRRLLPGLHR